MKDSYFYTWVTEKGRVVEPNTDSPIDFGGQYIDPDYYTDFNGTYTRYVYWRVFRNPIKDD